MAHISVQKRIGAPRPRVFDVFSDIEKTAEYIHEIIKIERLTDGPIGNGTRWRETRAMLKRDATCELEISEFIAGEKYCVIAEVCGVQYNSTFRFHDDGPGTVVECDMTSQPTTTTARVLGIALFPMTWLMRGMLKKCVDADMEDLKHAIESNAVLA